MGSLDKILEKDGVKRILLINSKYIEFAGIVFIAISGNFIFNIITKHTGLQNYSIFGFPIRDGFYNFCYGLFYISSGIFYLYYSYQLQKIENDYIKTDLSIEQLDWKIKRLPNKLMKVYLYIPFLFLTSIMIPFLATNQNIKSIKSVDIYSNNREISLQSKYSNYNGYPYNQYNLLKYLISKDSVNNESLSIIDIACGSGDFITMIKDSFPKITVLGSDGDINVVNFAKNKLEKKEYETFIINEPVLWQELTENEIIKLREWDYVLLLGNSIPMIDDEENLTKIFIEINKTLKKDGILLIDYNSLSDYHSSIETKDNHEIGRDKATGNKIYEEFKNKDNFIIQNIYESDTKETKLSFSNKLNKYCLNPNNLERHLNIANFKILKNENIDSIYNCNDLSLIVAQKK